MNKILLLLSLCLMIAAGCGIPSDAFNNKGTEKLNEGNYREAIEYFDKAITLNEKNVTAYENRAVARYKLQDLTGSIKDLKKAAELKPGMAVAYYNIAEIKTELQDYQGAIDYYDKAIAANPYYGVAAHNRGTIKMNLKNYNEAIKDFTLAAQMETNDTMPHIYKISSYVYRAAAHHLINDNEAAFTDLDSALQLAPKSPLVFYNLGHLNFDLQNYDKAVQYFNMTLEIEPRNPVATFYSGLIDIKTGHKDIGCAELRKSVRLGLTGGEDSVKKYCQ